MIIINRSKEIEMRKLKMKDKKSNRFHKLYFDSKKILNNEKYFYFII